VSWSQGWGPFLGAIVGAVIWVVFCRRIPIRAATPTASAAADTSAIESFTADVADRSVPTRGVPEILADLHALTGLAEAKRTIAEILASVQASRAREAHGLSPIIQSLHCTFEGPPGTGKTTVARLLGELFNAAGVFPGRPVFIEATKSDLVAGYVGQTAPKVRAVCASAAGGVLFVDEAYGLMPSGQGHDFSGEAITELLTQMENGRRQFCVVLAGYSREIDALIRSNPGLESRVSFRVFFTDYSPDELVQIAEREMTTRQYRYSPEVLTAIRAQISRHGGKLPGNARDIRQMIEQAIRRAAMAGRATDLHPQDFS